MGIWPDTEGFIGVDRIVMDWTRTAKPYRRAFALLVVLMVVAMIAVAPAPIRAVNGKPDHLPVYSACTGNAIKPTGLLDVVGHFAEQGINCLAYYGITFGKTPLQFAPDEPITRWQMALFMVRAAVPAGISVPVPSDQGFEDINQHSSHIQDAINQLAALEISKGTSPTTFHPDAPMDRRQMALFLYRFLQLAPTGPGGADASLVIPDDNVFMDLGGQSAQVIAAVQVIYEMGITLGVTPTTFSPGSLLTRAQMALFVTRALAHTNARPAGVSLQSSGSVIHAGDTLNVQVTVRDSGFRPRTGRLVDLFATAADDPYASFNKDGSCQRGAESAFGGRACTIDRSDRLLDDSGNLQIVLTPADDIRLWAWTGSLESEFRLGSTPSASQDIQVLKPASGLQVTDDMPITSKGLKLGEPVEFVFQLVDDAGRLIGESGYRVQVTTTYETNGVSDLTNVKTYRTDAGGKVTVTYQAADPNLAARNDVVALDIDVDAQGLKVVDNSTLGVVEGDVKAGDVRVTWSEQTPVATTLRLRQRVGYHQIPDSGPGTVHVVTGILTDQYGDPVAGTGIEFLSDDKFGLGPSPTVRSTNAQGATTLRYIWSGKTPSSERISARTVDRRVTATPLIHYWAVHQDKEGSALGVPILLHDVGKNVILHDARRPALVRYDDNDRLTIRGIPVDIEAFEEALYSGSYARISYVRYSPDPDDSGSFDLTNTREFEDIP